MRILFISRAYPPVVGGIENQNYELGKWLGKIAEVKIIANKKGKKFLPFFLPYAIIKSLFIARKYDAILLGDGVLGIVGWIIKLFYDKPIICVIHGLDLTYKSDIYQRFWVKIFIRKLDKLIAVGNETARVAQEKLKNNTSYFYCLGNKSKQVIIPKIFFIPNGVDTEKCFGNYDRKEIEKIIGGSIEGKKIILTSGRLAKRKGAAWFIRNVMPKLAKNIIYIIVGDGPDKNNIRDAIKDTGLGSRIKLLGYAPDETRNILFNTCDIFVQPNIKVPGDMEGFGISVIEAASCKIPVVAAKLEGLKDAIIDGENGFLVESENPEAWTNKINELLNNNDFCREFGEKSRQCVINNFSWEKIAERYLEEIRKTASKF